MSKLPVGFLIGVGFFGGVLACYLTQKVIAAQGERHPLVTQAGMKIGELNLDSRNCAVSSEPGIRIGLRKSVPGGAAAPSNPYYNPDWHVEKYGVTVEFIQPLHTIPAISMKQSETK